MSEQISSSNNTTELSALAERASASGNWWQEDTLDRTSDMVLPTRVIRVLENAGITTVEQLKATGPHRLRELAGIGKLGFEQIIGLLRALDRANGGDS